MKTKSMLEKMILECEIDEKIETGVFNVHNPDHLLVLVEHMVEFGMTKSAAEKLLESALVDEGKYPERQAFNKEGWLVTFPSKQYRDAALKEGTHSIADPTHGKGGMNLYYKKKGKQQRQTQQDPTQTEPAQPAVAPKAPAATGKVKKSVPPPQPQPVDDEDEYFDYEGDEADLDKYLAAHPAADEETPAPQDSTLPAAGTPNTKTPPPAAGQQPAAPAPAAPPPAPAAPDYTKPSKQFAMEKGWKATPYGEWRDKQGNTKAVTGVSGEVVPIENVFRDELKLYVQKNAPAPVAPAPEAPLPPA